MQQQASLCDQLIAALKAIRHLIGWKNHVPNSKLPNGVYVKPVCDTCTYYSQTAIILPDGTETRPKRCTLANPAYFATHETCTCKHHKVN